MPRAAASAGVDLEHRLALDRAQAGDVDEARVEEVARRRRDHRQRKARARARARSRRFVVGHVVGHAEARRSVDSGTCRSSVGKPPSANGASASVELDASPAPAAASKSTPPRPRAKAMRASASSSSAKHGSSKPMRAASSRKTSVFGFGLAERRDRRLVEQHVGVAVAGVDVECSSCVVAGST